MGRRYFGTGAGRCERRLICEGNRTKGEATVQRKEPGQSGAAKCEEARNETPQEVVSMRYPALAG